jgi:hypothetical protein
MLAGVGHLESIFFRRKKWTVRILNKDVSVQRVIYVLAKNKKYPVRE